MTAYIVRADLARGEMRRSHRADTPDAAIDMVADALDVALSGRPAEVPGRPGYSITAAQGGGRSLLATLHAPDMAPMLTVAVCTKSRSSAKLWAMMHEGQQALLTRADDPPSAPWMAERVEGPALLHMEDMRWSGSLAQGLAWAWMDYQGGDNEQ